MAATDTITNAVAKFYVDSADFNGIRLDELVRLVRDKLDVSEIEAVDTVAILVREGQVSLTFASVFNPHIKARPDLPTEEQVAKLRGEPPCEICVYPAEAVVRSAVDVSQYDDRPFAKRLLLGEPQLTTVFFDLQVLDSYYSDPRYYYEFVDYQGRICILTDHYESQDVPKRDKVLLERFGMGYDPDRNRLVVVSLRDLARLSAEHQQVWSTYARSDTHNKMAAEYYEASIQGTWPDSISVYEAILREQALINEMVRLMGKPPLFRRTFETDWPRDFSVLLRPTLKGYFDFVHTMDKMLSDNINKDFFRDDIPLEEEITRKDGKVEVRQHATVSLLDKWLRKTVRLGDDAPYEAIVGPLRRVRQLRQRPAHDLPQDAFDSKYHRDQEELVAEVHQGLTGLCLVLSTHPRVKAAGFRLPDWLEQGKVKSF